MDDLTRHHHIFVLTGPVQGGKTTTVSEKVTQLRNRGVKVMGFLCPGSFSEGKRSAFDLENIETGDQIPMGSEREKKGWVKYRRFFFNPQAFLSGATWISESIKRDPDLIVIDEVGPMELEGIGWSEALDNLVKTSSVTQLWIVRQQILPEVIEKWKIPENHLFTIKTIEDLTHKWML